MLLTGRESSANFGDMTKSVATHFVGQNESRINSGWSGFEAG
jgi:hypothetical protein